MSDRLSQLEKLHAADPNDPFVTYGIALEHGKAGAFDTALDWLDRTLAIDRNHCYAYYQKAKMHSELGDDAKARAVLNEGIAVARQAGGPDAAHAAEEMGQLLTELDG